MTYEQRVQFRHSLTQINSTDLVDMLCAAAEEVFLRNSAGGFVFGSVFEDKRCIAVGAAWGMGFDDALESLRKVACEHQAIRARKNDVA